MTRVVEVIRRGRRGEDGRSSLKTVITVSANRTLKNSDSGTVFRCTAAVTLTLPSSTTPGWSVFVDADGANVILSAAGTINGSAGATITSGNSAFLYSDGTNYWMRFFVASAFAALAASEIAFTPIEGNAATDAQAAIASNTNRANRLSNGLAVATTTGTGNLYDLDPGYTVSGYAAGDVYRFTVDRANTGGAQIIIPTAGTRTIFKQDETLAFVNLVAGDLQPGETHVVHYDGTRLVLLTPSLARTNIRGVVRKATTAEAQAGTTAGAYPDVVGVKAAIEAQSPIKARGLITGSAATPTAENATNITSVTKNGDGDYTINFTTPMASSNYQAFVTVDEGGADGRCDWSVERSTNSVRVRIYYHTGTLVNRTFSLAVMES